MVPIRFSFHVVNGSAKLLQPAQGGDHGHAEQDDGQKSAEGQPDKESQLTAAGLLGTPGKLAEASTGQDQRAACFFVDPIQAGCKDRLVWIAW